MSFETNLLFRTTYLASFEVPFLRGVNFILPRESLLKRWTPPAQVIRSREKITRLGSLSVFKQGSRRKV